MTIPWDTPHIEDDPAPIPPARPAWLPFPGEPIDAETAARLMARYGPDVAAELERIAGIVRARFAEAAITVRLWTADDLAATWSPESDGALVGYVMVDDGGHAWRFRSALVLVDKQSGAVVVRDDTGLLDDK